MTSKSYDKERGTQATGGGIDYCLNQTLGAHAHCYPTNMGSVNNLYSPEQKQSRESIFAILDWIAGHKNHTGEQTFTGIINLDKPFDKPIVIPLNTQAASARHSADYDAIGGAHWVVCIILPKRFLTLKNFWVEHNNERIIYIDSLSSHPLPQEFINGLMNGMELEFETNESSNSTVSEGKFKQSSAAIFPNLEVVSLPAFKQQSWDNNDCGYWAVYNAIQILETGSVEYLRRHTAYSRTWEYRQRYPYLDQQLDFRSPLVQARVNQQTKAAMVMLNELSKAKKENVKATQEPQVTASLIAKTETTKATSSLDIFKYLAADKAKLHGLPMDSLALKKMIVDETTKFQKTKLHLATKLAEAQAIYTASIPNSSEILAKQAQALSDVKSLEDELKIVKDNVAAIENVLADELNFTKQPSHLPLSDQIQDIISGKYLAPEWDALESVVQNQQMAYGKSVNVVQLERTNKQLDACRHYIKTNTEQLDKNAENLSHRQVKVTEYKNEWKNLQSEEIAKAAGLEKSRSQLREFKRKLLLLEADLEKKIAAYHHDTSAVWGCEVSFIDLRDESIIKIPHGWYLLFLRHYKNPENKPVYIYASEQEKYGVEREIKECKEQLLAIESAVINVQSELDLQKDKITKKQDMITLEDANIALLVSEQNTLKCNLKLFEERLKPLEEKQSLLMQPQSAIAAPVELISLPKIDADKVVQLQQDLQGMRQKIECLEQKLFSAKNYVSLIIGPCSETSLIPIFTAIIKQDEDLVLRLIDATKENNDEVNLNFYDEHGWTPLHCAVMKAGVTQSEAGKNIIRILLQNGSAPHIANHEGKFPHELALDLHIKHFLLYEAIKIYSAYNKEKILGVDNTTIEIVDIVDWLIQLPELSQAEYEFRPSVSNHQARIS